MLGNRNQKHWHHRGIQTRQNSPRWTDLQWYIEGRAAENNETGRLRLGIYWHTAHLCALVVATCSRSKLLIPNSSSHGSEVPHQQSSESLANSLLRRFQTVPQKRSIHLRFALLVNQTLYGGTGCCCLMWITRQSM